MSHKYDTCLLFPPGTGGNFLFTLITGNYKTISNTNEYFTTSIANVEGKEYVRHHGDKSQMFHPKDIRQTICITSKDENVIKLVKTIFNVKRLLSEQTFISSLDKVDYNEDTADKFKDAYGDHSAIEFLLDSDKIERIKQTRNYIKEVFGNMANSTCRLIFLHGITNQPLKQLFEDLDMTQRYNWDLHGDINYSYEDIFIYRNLAGTIFEPFKKEITEYHNRNINLLECIDKQIGTNLLDRVIT